MTDRTRRLAPSVQSPSTEDRIDGHRIRPIRSTTRNTDGGDG